MTTLAPGAKRTLHLPALEAITIASGTGTIVRLNDNPGGGDPHTPIDLAEGETKIIGPFGGPTMHRIECTAGVISWTVSASDFPAVSSDIERIVKLTQSDYDALDPADSATLYVVVG